MVLAASRRGPRSAAGVEPGVVDALQAVGRHATARPDAGRFLRMPTGRGLRRVLEVQRNREGRSTPVHATGPRASSRRSQRVCRRPSVEHPDPHQARPACIATVAVAGCRGPGGADVRERVAAAPDPGRDPPACGLRRRQRSAEATGAVETAGPTLARGQHVASRAMRFIRIAACLPEVIQCTQSRRCTGVSVRHCASASGWAARASCTSSGTSARVPRAPACRPAPPGRRPRCPPPPASPAPPSTSDCPGHRTAAWPRRDARPSARPPSPGRATARKHSQGGQQHDGPRRVRGFGQTQQGHAAADRREGRRPGGKA